MSESHGGFSSFSCFFFHRHFFSFDILIFIQLIFQLVCQLMMCPSCFWLDHIICKILRRRLFHIKYSFTSFSTVFQKSVPSMFLPAFLMSAWPRFSPWAAGTDVCNLNVWWFSSYLIFSYLFSLFECIVGIINTLVCSADSFTIYNSLLFFKLFTFYIAATEVSHIYRK